MGDSKGKNLQARILGRRKAFLRKYLFNNLGIKTISFLSAVILWMAIVNIEDPYKERTFSVPVEPIHEEALVSVNKVYEVIEGNVAQVRVKGKKSVVDRLRTSDIRATADLSSLSAVNAVAIVPELTKNVPYEPELECSTVLKVFLEDRASKQVKVTVVTDGTPQDGYSIGECEASPNMLEVAGGKSVIKKIDSVRVTVNVNGVDEDFKKKVVPVACDANGDEVESSTLDYGDENPRVRVWIHVVRTKTISVNVRITGHPAAGYEFVKAECLPERIQIAGSDDDLQDISTAEIPVDITGMKSTSGYVEQNISIQEYLPEGITVLQDYAQVSLRIEVEKMTNRTVSVPVEDIRFVSLSDGLSAQIVGGQSVVEMAVKGYSSTLDGLGEDDLAAYVDCEGLRPGKHDLQVHLDEAAGITVIESAYVNVRIKKGGSVQADPVESGKDLEQGSENDPGQELEDEFGKEPEEEPEKEPEKEPEEEPEKDMEEDSEEGSGKEPGEGSGKEPEEGSGKKTVEDEPVEDEPVEDVTLDIEPTDHVEEEDGSDEGRTD